MRWLECRCSQALQPATSSGELLSSRFRVIPSPSPAAGDNSSSNNDSGNTCPSHPLGRSGPVESILRSHSGRCLAGRSSEILFSERLRRHRVRALTPSVSCCVLNVSSRERLRDDLYPFVVLSDSSKSEARGWCGAAPPSPPLEDTHLHWLRRWR